MMPAAPASSSRPITPYSRSGTRTKGTRPMSSAVAQMAPAASIGIALCSRSTQIAWWPLALASRAISAPRAWRTPSAATHWRRASRCITGLVLPAEAGEGVSLVSMAATVGSRPYIWKY